MLTTELSVVMTLKLKEMFHLWLLQGADTQELIQKCSLKKKKSHWNHINNNFLFVCFCGASTIQIQVQ